MYEQFTDRARKVFQLANQESQRRNHEYIGTEHILAGLIKEGSGVAASVLANAGIKDYKVAELIDKMVQSGPDMVTMGKLPHTPHAKRVAELAMDASRELGHNYVGTEHILLGLVREDEGVAAVILKQLGATDEILTKNIESVLLDPETTPLHGRYRGDLNRLLSKIDSLYEQDAIHIKRGFKVRSEGSSTVASNHLIEEAVELQAEVLEDNREGTIEEAGDLLTLFCHLLKRCHIPLQEVVDLAVAKLERVYTTDPSKVTAITSGVTRRGRKEAPN